MAVYDDDGLALSVGVHHVVWDIDKSNGTTRGRGRHTKFFLAILTK